MINFQMGWLALLFQGIFLFSDRGCLSLPMDFPPQIPEGISYGFVLPEFDINQAGRVEEIRTNREGFQYGPPLLGNTSFFPTGVLGDAMVARDKELWFRDVAYVTESVYREWPAAAQALAEVRKPCKTLKYLELMVRIGWWSTEPVQLQIDIRGTMESYHPRRSLSRRPYELDIGPSLLNGTIIPESICGETPGPSRETAIPRRCGCSKAGFGHELGSAAHYRSPVLCGPFLSGKVSYQPRPMDSCLQRLLFHPPYHWQLHALSHQDKHGR